VISDVFEDDYKHGRILIEGCDRGKLP